MPQTTLVRETLPRPYDAGGMIRILPHYLKGDQRTRPFPHRTQSAYIYQLPGKVEQKGSDTRTGLAALAHMPSRGTILLPKYLTENLVYKQQVHI